MRMYSKPVQDDLRWHFLPKFESTRLKADGVTTPVIFNLRIDSATLCWGLFVRDLACGPGHARDGDG